MSTAIFESLPGMETPVNEVGRTLASVWDFEVTPGYPAPSEFRASQMNLVVHLGLDNTVETARTAFETAQEFSRLYPCRAIVLCPRDLGSQGGVRAKVFCECFVGTSRHDMICSESIILSYPLEQRAYIENQASILIESDLPLYYWPSRINTAARFGDYQFFLNRSQRIVIDSAVERPDVPGYAWPRRELVRDLVHARILPIRQSIGHFLSYVEPSVLAKGLQSIRIDYSAGIAAEVRAMETWMKSGLAECVAQSGVESTEAKFILHESTTVGRTISVRWDYLGGGSLEMSFDLDEGPACLRSRLGSEQASLSSAVRLLPPEKALAEALFF